MVLTTDCPVTSGPSKWDLSLALFDRKDSQPRQVQFHANCNLSCIVTVTITGVQAEDGSGESWNIEGRATKIIRQKGVLDSFPLPKAGRVSIHFRTDSRQGRIRFLS